MRGPSQRKSTGAKTLPTGTITFFFTDIEGSSRLWEASAEAMRAALASHDAIIAATVERFGGQLVRSRGEGDSAFAVFPRASDAVATAAAVQRALASEPWPTPSPLRVRIGLHTGEAGLRDGDYYGPEVNRCARLRALARGGQTLMSETTANLVRRSLPPDVDLQALGAHRLKDLQHPEQVFELLHHPPGRSAALLRTFKRLVKPALSPPVLGATLAAGLVLVLLFILLIAGSSSQDGNTRPATTPATPTTPPDGRYAWLPNPESTVDHSGGLRLRIRAQPEALDRNQAVQVTIHLENPASEAREIRFLTGQEFDLWVKGVAGPDAGREVFDWAEGQVFPARSKTIALRPGQSEVLGTVSWTPPVLNRPSSAATASYRIRVVVLTEKPVEASLDLYIGKP